MFSFFAIRLHANILAYIMRIPSILVNYHPKCLGFAEETQIPHDFILQLNQLADSMIVEEKILNALNTNNREVIESDIERRYSACMEHFEKIILNKSNSLSNEADKCEY